MSLSNLLTVFLLTFIPIELSSSAIFRAVFLVHFRPVIGSPAVSYSISLLIFSVTSDIFFCAFSPLSRPTDPLGLNALP